jgi:SulP family sulfate permease
VNALAILIFAAQLPHLHGASAATWAHAGAGAGAHLRPAVAGPAAGVACAVTAIPSPLICVVVLSVLASASWACKLPTVGDLGQLPDALPVFALPQVPASLDTLRIILLPALAIAMVGLLESVLTAAVVDELTDTPSDKNRECAGLGVANIAASLFGGIAGCGMIGQAVGNVKYGGRGRLSTLFAGVFLLILMVALKDWVSQVPVIALVAIMVMVSAETFDWKSLGALVRHPRLSSAAMLATVVSPLPPTTWRRAWPWAWCSAACSLRSRSRTCWRCACTTMTQTGQRTWRVSGQVFFASADAFIEAFDVLGAEGRAVVIDVTHAHFWDITAVAALDKVVERLRHHGCTVQVLGLNAASAVLIDRMGSDAAPLSANGGAGGRRQLCSGCSSSPGTTQRLLSSTKRSPKRSRSFFVQRLRVYRGKSVANKALPSCEGEADVVNLSSTRKGWPLGAQ